MSGGQLVVMDRSGRDVKRYSLPDGLVTLGSDPDCDIRVMLPAIKQHHATVVVRANQTVVRNVSDGETLVNGHVVSVAALSHGDVITLGDRSLRWEYYEPTVPRPLAAEPGATKQVAIVQPQRRDEIVNTTETKTRVITKPHRPYAQNKRSSRSTKSSTPRELKNSRKRVSQSDQNTSLTKDIENTLNETDISLSNNNKSNTKHRKMKSDIMQNMALIELTPSRNLTPKKLLIDAENSTNVRKTKNTPNVVSPKDRSPKGRNTKTVMNISSKSLLENSTETKASQWIASRKTSPRKSGTPKIEPKPTKYVHVATPRPKEPYIETTPSKMLASSSPTKVALKRNTPLRTAVLRKTVTPNVRSKSIVTLATKTPSTPRTRVHKIEEPLTIDDHKKAALLLLTRTPKSNINVKQKTPVLVVTSPVRTTPRRTYSGRPTPQSKQKSKVKSPNIGRKRGSKTSPQSSSKLVTGDSVSDFFDPSQTLDDKSLSPTRSLFTSPLLPSPRKSAMKDPLAKKSYKKIESIKFDLSNIESRTYDESEHMETSKIVQSPDIPSEGEEDLTLRYSESPPPRPSPRRSIHSRSCKIMHNTLGDTFSIHSSEPDSTAQSATSLISPRKSLRSSLIVQNALNNSLGGTTHSPQLSRKRSQKDSVNTPTKGNTSEKDRSLPNTETYSIVDLVSLNTNESGSVVDLGSVDANESTISPSVYDSAASDRDSTNTYRRSGANDSQRMSSRRKTYSLSPSHMGTSTPYVEKLNPRKSALIRSQSNLSETIDSPNPRISPRKSLHDHSSQSKLDNSNRSIEVHGKGDTFKINSSFKSTSRKTSSINNADASLSQGTINSPRSRISPRNSKSETYSLTPRKSSLIKSHNTLSETIKSPDPRTSLRKSKSLHNNISTSQSKLDDSNKSLEVTCQGDTFEITSSFKSTSRKTRSINTADASLSQETTHSPSLRTSPRKSKSNTYSLSPSHIGTSTSYVGKSTPRKSSLIKNHNTLSETINSLDLRTSPRESKSLLNNSSRSKRDDSNRLLEVTEQGDTFEITSSFKSTNRKTLSPSHIGTSTSYVGKSTPRKSSLIKNRNTLSETINSPDPRTSPRKSKSLLNNSSRSKRENSDRLLEVTDQGDTFEITSSFKSTNRKTRSTNTADSSLSETEILKVSSPRKNISQQSGSIRKFGASRFTIEEPSTPPENIIVASEPSTPILNIQDLLHSSNLSVDNTPDKRQKRKTNRQTIGGGVTKRKIIVATRGTWSDPRRATKSTNISKVKFLSAKKALLKSVGHNSSGDSNKTDKNDGEGKVTPKSNVKLVAPGVKEIHSTAKKPVSKRSIIDDLSESVIVKQLFNSPVKRKLSQSMSELGKTVFFEEGTVGRKRTRATVALTGRTPNQTLDFGNIETPQVPTEVFVSPMATPNQSPNMDGVKRLFRKNSPANDLTNVRGVKQLLRTPRKQKSPQNDLTNVSGVKTTLNKRSPANDLTDVAGVKHLYDVNKNKSRLSGVRSLFQSEKKNKSPKNDLTDVRGVKRLFTSKESHLERKKSKNNSSVVQGKRKSSRSGTNTDTDSYNLSGVEELFQDTSTTRLSPNKTFDLLLGKPPLKATYSKTFRERSKTPNRDPKTTQSLRNEPVDFTSINVEAWVDHKLHEQTHREPNFGTKNVAQNRELQKLTTYTVEGMTPIVKSRVRNSTINKSETCRSDKKRISNFDNRSLPIKKRSIINTSRTPKEKTKGRKSSLPIKKRTIVHSTPVPNRRMFAPNISELGRVSPIVADKQDSVPEPLQAPFTKSPKKLLSSSTSANASAEYKRITAKVTNLAEQVSDATPKKNLKETRAIKPVTPTRTTRTRRGAKTSLVITKKPPVMSPVVITENNTPRRGRKAKVVIDKQSISKSNVVKQSPKKVTRKTRGAAKEKAETVKINVKETPVENQKETKTRSRNKRNSLTPAVIIAKPSPKMKPQSRQTRAKQATQIPPTKAKVEPRKGTKKIAQEVDKTKEPVQNNEGRRTRRTENVEVKVFTPKITRKGKTAVMIKSLSKKSSPVKAIKTNMRAGCKTTSYSNVIETQIVRSKTSHRNKEKVNVSEEKIGRDRKRLAKDESLKEKANVSEEKIGRGRKRVAKDESLKEKANVSEGKIGRGRKRAAKDELLEKASVSEEKATRGRKRMAKDELLKGKAIVSEETSARGRKRVAKDTSLSKNANISEEKVSRGRKRAAKDELLKEKELPNKTRKTLVITVQDDKLVHQKETRVRKLKQDTGSEVAIRQTRKVIESVVEEQTRQTRRRPKKVEVSPKKTTTGRKTKDASAVQEKSPRGRKRNAEAIVEPATSTRGVKSAMQEVTKKSRKVEEKVLSPAKVRVTRGRQKAADSEGAVGKRRARK